MRAEQPLNFVLRLGRNFLDDLGVMASPIGSVSSLRSAWEVLMLFLIPVGGGIPGGVLLARSRGLAWPVMMILYFISDIILAFLFEPIMLLLFAAAKRSALLTRWGEGFKKMMRKSTSQYGSRLSPFALIMVAFGVDPMTGRAAAAAAGHGFVAGWALSITGDMLFFVVLMVSTLWLNSILGDETKTTVIILLAMMFGPSLVRRFRERLKGRG